MKMILIESKRFRVSENKTGEKSFNRLKNNWKRKTMTTDSREDKIKSMGAIECEL